MKKQLKMLSLSTLSLLCISELIQKSLIAMNNQQTQQISSTVPTSDEINNLAFIISSIDLSNTPATNIEHDDEATEPFAPTTNLNVNRRNTRRRALNNVDFIVRFFPRELLTTQEQRETFTWRNIAGTTGRISAQILTQTALHAVFGPLGFYLTQCINEIINQSRETEASLRERIVQGIQSLTVGFLTNGIMTSDIPQTAIQSLANQLVTITRNRLSQTNQAPETPRHLIYRYENGAFVSVSRIGRQLTTTTAQTLVDVTQDAFDEATETFGQAGLRIVEQATSSIASYFMN